MGTCLPPRLALVGLRGVGKSVCGALLAERLRVRFVDLDDRIAEAAGAAHAGEVIAREGLAAFRVRESNELRAALTAPERLVLSTGGGAVEDPGSRALLKTAAVTVWLRAPLALLRDRVARDEALEQARQEGRGDGIPLRPSIVEGPKDSGCAAPADEFVILEGRRAPLYREVSRRAVDVESLSPEEIALRLEEIWLG